MPTRTVVRSSKTGKFVKKSNAKSSPKTTQKENIGVSEKKILKAFNEYKRQLWDSPKVSKTQFQYMQTAIVGCSYLINDLFGSKRKKVYAQTK